MTLRVLHVLEALEGGTSRHLIDVATNVEGVEHHVAIPSRRIGGLTDATAHDRLARAGATVHRVEMRRSPLRPQNAFALWQLRRLIRRIRPDVVHTHSSVGGALGRIAAVLSSTPRVHTPNALAEGRVAIAIERVLGARTDRLIAVSTSEAQQMQAERLAAPEHITVIPNGIELDPPPPDRSFRRDLGVPDGAPLVGTIARLIHQKAPERFVRLAALVGEANPSAHFVVIGDGPLRPALERDLAATDLGDRFHLVPERPGAAAVLTELDVFVLLSRFEGAPYAPLEAMRAAVPVVLSDVVGNRDAVEHPHSGILVAEDDVRAAADAVGALLRDPPRAAELGRAGQARIAERFDVRSTAQQLAALYRAVAEARSAS